LPFKVATCTATPRYTPKHNARIARGVAEREVERAALVQAGGGGGGGGAAAATAAATAAAGRCRRVIVGHSMGGLAAAIAAARGDVDDVILVAPAVIAKGGALQVESS
jgi:hypothetical protein